MNFFSTIHAKSAAHSAAKRWVWIPPDQLMHDHPLTNDREPGETGLIFLETSWRPSLRPYHKQKLIFVLSSQRHFALEMTAKGHPVIYRFGEDDYGALLEETRRSNRLGPVELLEPSEPEIRNLLIDREGLEIGPNQSFITDRSFYDRVFAGKKTRRLETFYRAARDEHGVLMEGGNPAGGAWNFDRENRERWEGDPPVPERPWFEPDEITREVIELVDDRYPGHFGRSTPFGWPVTRDNAQELADHFFDELLPWFGPFEDAMHRDERFLFHSLLSAPLNNGLLDPMDLCRRAERAWRDGSGTIASVEGFVRQILGWREFMRHAFEERQPDWAGMNALEATAALPGWYWTGDSGLECLDQSVRSVVERAHSHHITRLMVLSNLATLIGVNPQELNAWFWFAYIDAWEWVVTPNVIGMATWGDGGFVASKPYVSSARYIRKMGPSLCAACRYDPTEAAAEDACPFNYSYWDFIARHRETLSRNHRMRMIVSQLDRFDREKLAVMQQNARRFRERARAASVDLAEDRYEQD